MFHQCVSRQFRHINRPGADITARFRAASFKTTTGVANFSLGCLYAAIKKARKKTRNAEIVISGAFNILVLICKISGKAVTANRTNVKCANMLYEVYC